MNIKRFVLCINNENYESSLEKWKLYPVISEEELEGYIRIIDESGEDYLYESKMFIDIMLPKEITKNIELEIESS